MNTKKHSYNLVLYGYITPTGFFISALDFSINIPSLRDYAFQLRRSEMLIEYNSL
jgi:hypothetical protein